MKLGLAHGDAQRHAGGNALRHANDVGLHAGVFNRKPFARAADATLHFVDHQQDAVLVADAPQFLHENGRSDDVSAFALNRLDENGGDFFRRENSFEQFVFDVARAAEREFLGILRTTRAAAIHIGIADVGHAGHERREAPLLLRLRRRQRERSHGAPMESAEEGDHVLPLAVIARQLQSALDGFRAGVSVIDLVRSRHGHNFERRSASVTMPS
jgi:hypothetical protein